MSGLPRRGHRLSKAADLTGLRPSVTALTKDDLRLLIDSGHSPWADTERDCKVFLGASPSVLARQFQPEIRVG